MHSWVTATALSWLKIASFCITSLLALLGLLFDFKVKHTGQLNRWGRINLCGLVLAFVVGIAAQVKEDRDKSEADKKAKDITDSLVDANTKQLSKLETVVKDNDQLIKNTQASLTAENKTDADTQHTLRDVNRSMESIGDTISAAFSVGFSPPASDLEGMRENIKEFSSKYSNHPPSGSWFEDDTLINFDGKGGPRVQFGQASPILPPHSITVTYINQPPFSLSFVKDSPQLRALLKGDHSKTFAVLNDAVRFQYDPAETGRRLPAPNTINGVKEPLELLFTSSAKSALANSQSDIIFRRVSSSADFLSARDVEGSYLILQKVTHGQDYRVCRLNLSLGPRTIAIPIDNGIDDEMGDRILKMPSKIDQTPEERGKAHLASNKCEEGVTSN